ncbi:MAG TPA: hypothetical protein PLS03_03150, partial [Terrimicrobiaceae bacterium]|nr:hypothetical protein [Terrimicrobiaceae bacterium]
PAAPQETFCQYDGTQFMLRRGALKYLHVPGGDVLFDLASDPGETQNLIGRPEYQTEAGQMLRDIRAFAATACDRPGKG